MITKVSSRWRHIIFPTYAKIDFAAITRLERKFTICPQKRWPEGLHSSINANHGDENLLLAATSVMDQAATTEEGAKEVIESGSLDACLDSIQSTKANVESAALSATQTMTKIASESAKHFVNTGTTEKSFKLWLHTKSKVLVS